MYFASWWRQLGKGQRTEEEEGYGGKGSWTRFILQEFQCYNLYSSETIIRKLVREVVLATLVSGGSVVDQGGIGTKEELSLIFCCYACGIGCRISFFLKSGSVSVETPAFFFTFSQQV